MFICNRNRKNRSEVLIINKNKTEKTKPKKKPTKNLKSTIFYMMVNSANLRTFSFLANFKIKTALFVKKLFSFYASIHWRIFL